MAKNRSKQNKADSQTSSTDEVLSAQEILSQGEEAAQLLNSPIYNLAYRSVVQRLQDDWISTKAHEREKREGLYQMVQGLSAVANEMNMMIEQAKMLGDDELAKERKLQLAYEENEGFPGHSRRA